MGELVSIIMPAYNAEKYVAESIRSVLSQTYSRWELIVVDDGSNDRTAEIVKQFASSDPRIIYISQANGGQGKARNTGIRQARGDLIAFLDSDDLWLEEKLQRQVPTLATTAADVVFTDGYIFEGDNQSQEVLSFNTITGRFEGADLLPMLFAENKIPILSALAKKSALLAAGMFPEERRFQNCEDYDLWLKLAERGAVFYGLGEKLVRYRRHTSSATVGAGTAISGPLAGVENSRTLKATIAVLQSHQRAVNLPRSLVSKRFTVLYSALFAALLAENRVSEARQCLKALRHWGGFGPKLLLKYIVVQLVPGRYRSLQVGWRNVTDKLKSH